MATVTPGRRFTGSHDRARFCLVHQCPAQVLASTHFRKIEAGVSQGMASGEPDLANLITGTKGVVCQFKTTTVVPTGIRS